MHSRAEFYPHQEHGVDFITSRPASALWWDMGLMKTITALTGAVHMLNDFAIERVLVVAPKRVAESVWHREAAVWEHTKHLTVARAVGTEKERRAAIAEKADITVINRENVPWLVSKCPWEWDGTILDEAHSFKSRSATRFRAMRAVRKKVRWMVQLTGTPAPNKLLDLWSQIFLLDGGAALGKSFTAYRDTYFFSDYMGYSWTPHKWAEAKIYERIGHLVMSLKDDERVKLPERIDNLIWVDLPAPAMKQYRDLEKNFLLQHDKGTITAQNAAVLSGKLTQAANGFLYRPGEEALHLHDAKLEALKEIIEQQDGRPTLVVYNFKEDLAALRRAFPKAVLFESTSDEDNWNAGKIEILLVHPASAGEGLNLQHGGSTMVWYGIPWSLGQYLQMNKRLHRQGQLSTVVIHHILSRKTIDVTMLAAINGKYATQEALLAALKHDMENRK